MGMQQHLPANLLRLDMGGFGLIWAKWQTWGKIWAKFVGIFEIWTKPKSCIPKTFDLLYGYV